MDADSAAFWTETRQAQRNRAGGQSGQQFSTSPAPTTKQIPKFQPDPDPQPVSHVEKAHHTGPTVRGRHNDGPATTPSLRLVSWFPSSLFIETATTKKKKFEHCSCAARPLALREESPAGGDGRGHEREPGGKGGGKKASTHGNAVLRAIPLVSRLAAEPLVLAAVGEDAHLGRELIIGAARVFLGRVVSFTYLCYDSPWRGTGGAEGAAREGGEEGGGEDLHGDRWAGSRLACVRVLVTIDVIKRDNELSSPSKPCPKEVLYVSVHLFHEQGNLTVPIFDRSSHGLIRRNAIAQPFESRRKSKLPELSAGARRLSGTGTGPGLIHKVAGGKRQTKPSTQT
ncbi:hypothetical protein Purlil1_7063 [Purpureocillium lilacinum]|uniref:Uncharacterized protein n=1 Tax=Purpureocillium lilacinum TaxID=33203 RepID=A0ABR0BXB2_PURLI|nr:hypothetical protein Purlil1_7063 [Purpureocillium lilacinum]